MAYTYCNRCGLEVEFDESKLEPGTRLNHVTCFDCLDEHELNALRRQQMEHTHYHYSSFLDNFFEDTGEKETGLV